MEIPLFNRDGANLKLVSEDNHTWHFQVDKGHQWVLEHIRVGYDDNKNITFIDPSGGPYLAINSLLTSKLKIESFSWKEGPITIYTIENKQL